MKRMSVYSDDSIYGTAFFDGDVCVGYVHYNDGSWREEYFNPIIEHFGVKAFIMNSLNAKQKRSLKKEANI